MAAPVHPSRITVLAPRAAAYLACGLVVLPDLDLDRLAAPLLLLWVLLAPWLMQVPLPERTHPVARALENVMTPVLALLAGLPVVMVAALAFTFLLGHLNVGGIRPSLESAAATALVGLATVVLGLSPPLYGSLGGTVSAIGLFAGFALVAAALGHRRSVRLQAAREEIAEQAARHEALAHRLARYLPPPVHRAAFDLESGISTGPRRRWLSVCFVDLAGFTALTDGGESEEVVAMLDDFYTAMAEATLEHGGTLDKFIGDAVMVFFGEPTSRGRQGDARACLDMAVDMQRRFVALRRRWQAGGLVRDLGLRIGIHSGWCTVGNLGQAARMEYTVIGATVNAASRLEGAAGRGQVLVSRTTWLLLGDHAHRCRRLGPVTAKGFRHPIEAFEYRGERAATAPVDLSGEGFSLRVEPETVDADGLRRAMALVAEVVPPAQPWTATGSCPASTGSPVAADARFLEADPDTDEEQAAGEAVTPEPAGLPLAISAVAPGCRGGADQIV